MTAPQYPYSPPRRRSTADIVATSVVLVIAAATGVLSLAFSMFFPMATDACADDCNTSLIGWAYLMTWGGVGIAAIVAVGGTVIAAACRRVMWVWPTVALVLIIVTVVIAVGLVGSVMPHH
jgi:hypothetical protein